MKLKQKISACIVFFSLSFSNIVFSEVFTACPDENTINNAPRILDGPLIQITNLGIMGILLASTTITNERLNNAGFADFKVTSWKEVFVQGAFINGGFVVCQYDGTLLKAGAIKGVPAVIFITLEGKKGRLISGGLNQSCGISSGTSRQSCIFEI